MLYLLSVGTEGTWQKVSESELALSYRQIYICMYMYIALSHVWPIYIALSYSLIL